MPDKNVPNHLGIILDGNRRWAEEKGLPAFAGHKKGAEAVKKIIEAAKAREVNILTLFVFSTENWKRPKKETTYLMRLMEWSFSQYENDKNGVSVRIIGLTENLPAGLRKKIADIQEKTKGNKGMILNFALSYGGRAEIVEAIKNIIRKKIVLEKINEDVIKENLWTSDVDLVIRTGKEQRLSNFLIWQSAYSEFYFSQKYWPDFTEKDLDEAFLEYAKRRRRFGN